MRKLLFTLSVILFIAFGAAAQAPYFFNYQGVARNSVGNALVNKSIGLRLTIRDGGALGIPVYTETRKVITNNFGLFNIQVGGAGATNVAGSISGSLWQSGTKWMQVEIDPEGGTSFKDIGTTQLISVPYALYSNLTGDIVLPFTKSQNEDVPLFKLTNTGNNASSLAYEGLSNSTANNATAIRGVMTPVSPGFFSSAVMGRNNGTGNNGFGVHGYQNGTGAGVYGETPGGIGVYGASTTGIGVYGQSLAFGPSVKGHKNENGQGNVGFFENISTINFSAALRVQTNGPGDGVNMNMTGLGKGGVFGINNGASLANLMEFTTNGASGSVAILLNTNSTNPSNVFDVRSNGLGKIGFLQNTNTSNNTNVFEVQTAGLGRTGLLQNTNAANGASVLEVQTNGTGKVGFLQNTNAASVANSFEVQTAGMGRTGLLQNTNAANTANVLEVQTNGSGKTGFLQNTNATNAANVLEVQTNGLGRAGVLENTNIINTSNVLDARTAGTGRVGFLQNTNATNASNVIEVQTNGTGRTGLLQNTNAVNAANVLEVQTNGIGKVGFLQNTNATNAANALEVQTAGTGRTGLLQNTNATNASNVLEIQTNGTGRGEFVQNTNAANAANVLEVQSNGLGRVGVLQNTNAANASNVFDARTNGTGRVGYMQNTNGANNSNVLEVQTSGSGRAGLLQNTNAANAANVFEVQTNGSGKVAVLENTNATNNNNIVEAKTNGLGRVGFMQNTNAVNAANVLEVQTNGTGRVGVLENTNAGNPNNVLDARTNGTGKVGFMQNTNAANSSNALEVQTNGTGKVAFFQANNASSAANALHATSNGTGYTTYIQNTNANPANRKALVTDGSVLINDPTQSIDSVTGALVVKTGGIGVAGNLNVGGAAAFSGEVSFKAPVLFLSPLESTGPTVGAVTVVGGVGIGKRLNVAGNTYLSGDLTTLGSTVLLGTALINGATTINNTLSVSASSSFVANFVNTSNQNGISIQVAGATPANANNFIEFRNGTGGVVGRVEGETLAELLNNDDYKVEIKSLDLAITMASIDVATGAVGVVMAGVELVAASTSSTGCVGLGACVTAPIPSEIVGATVNLAAAIANEVAVALGLDDAITQKNYFETTAAANIGVTYQSGSGDYAEWLPKANLTEKFKPGFVVGMKNGSITLNTAGADKLFVISTKPIVLGNMPEAGKESDYERVAFMGQVPVHVLGKVKAGDYILPSGHNNGFAKAVSPEKMQPGDYASIVGMAWSSSSNDSYNIINVAIGLNTGDVSKLVAEQSKEISALKGQISETNNILAKLVPGFKEAAGLSEPVTVKNTVIQPKVTTADHAAVEIAHTTAGAIVYFEVSDDQVEKGLVIAQKMFIEKGGDINAHPFWKKMKNDPAYKQVVINEMKKKIKESMHFHKDINNEK